VGTLPYWPGKVEEDHVFGIVRDQVRNVRRAHKGEPELILGIAGLFRSLRPDGKWIGIQGTVSAGPKERAVGLVGLEVAEIAEPAASEPSASTAAATPTTAASSASTATTKTSASAAKASTPSWPTPSGATSSGSTALPEAASRASIAGERLIQFGVLAKLLHIDTCERIGRA
jgi:hypothetical protein